MTTSTGIDVTTMAPLTHDEAMALQAVELERTLGLLRSLDESDWTAQTDCPDWDVHHMYLHVLGACDAATSMRETVHQMRAAKKYQKINGGPLEAALSATQVAERSDLDPAALVERLTAVAPVTVRKRTRLPSLLRKMKMKVDGPVEERWALGYLVDTIYLRDLWMHRVDAARAVDRNLELTAEHDGRIVADVVAEWSRRHREPFTLNLTGPARGRYHAPGDGPHLDLDAVELCRALVGRADAEGLLSTIVPF